MASFASQRCSMVSACPNVRAKASFLAPARAAVPSMGAQRQHIRVRSADDDRKALLHTFYHEFQDQQKLSSIMADDFTMSEEGGSKTYSKRDYLGIFGAVLAAIPDFKWGAASNGETDNDGFAIVTVTATGHHTGAPLQLPNLEPVPASGKHFCLAEEVQKVKVNGNKVQQIVVLPNKGAGPRALYQVLGGQLPVKSSA